MPTHRLELTPLLRTLSIKGKDGLVLPFHLDRTYVDEHGCHADFGWAQREFVADIERQYNAGKPIRIIVLKARQLGISTLTEAILFLWNFLHPGSGNLVIAHQTKSTRALFEKTKLFWRAWPKELSAGYSLQSDTQHRLAWSNLSTMEVATAGSVQSARGMTLNGVHCSEVAFWDEPDDLMLGLKQTIPRRDKTILVLESTANGRGDYFHQTWTDAEAGTSEFSPLFFPWWKHWEYTAQHIGISPELDGQLDNDEKFLRDTFGLDENRLAWRRFSIDNDCNGDPDFFKQEYPATPHEAFLHTGNNIFSEPKLQECYAPMEGERGFFQAYGERIEWIPDRTGPWTVFFMPADDRTYGQYFVGADPTHSTGTDRACIQVINRRSLEQVAVYHGYDEPIRLGHEVLKVANFYNEAMVSSEAEGPGYGTIATLLNSNYPNIWQWRRFDRLPGSNMSNLYGWSSGYKNKELAVSHLRHMVNKGEFGPLGKTMGEDGRWHAGIHDAVTYAQMCDFSVTDRWVNGSMYGNADAKGFDDAVDALCIAHICSYSDGPLEFYDTRTANPNLEPDLDYPIRDPRSLT